ncbi:MAG: DUF3426 domain-containing protein [Polaromonas sp.]
MSLVTRCPACTTMFKVVADQLKVAQGWVRCGHCGAVFEASLHLMPDEAGGLGGLVSTPDTNQGLAQAVVTQDTPQELPAPIASGDLAEVEAVQTSLPPEAPEETPEVSFVSEARRNEFWKLPQVRAVLGLIFLLLLSALALQWMVQQKDVLAAQEPRIATLLQALCRPLGCQVRPLRRIESLVIDSSSFSKTGPDAYHLTFVFKNTGAAALEIPALEVTLTDSRDQALVRRVLMPAQFGATAVTLDAYSELAGAVSLKVSSEDAQGGTLPTPVGPFPVVGYRILAFYP